MSDNRPTEWQWKTPEGGKIDGLTHAEWEVRGVDVFARREGDDFPHFRKKDFGGKFCDRLQYAPATLGGLPATWPPRMDWQWRQLERDMDAQAWRAVPYWRKGCHDSGGMFCIGMWDSRGPGVVAKAGEWWAPEDEHGNPCEWPEVEPQPVVVIPAAEMTAQVLYGHQAMGGTWRYREQEWDGERWSTNGGYRCSDVYDGEQWAPCDERGDFCALRRVVPEQETRGVTSAKEARISQERDELKARAAQAVKLWDLGHGLGDVIAEMRMELAREEGEK